MKQIPVTEKLNLSIKEAAAYTGVGERRLREMCKAPNCDFCLHIGSKKKKVVHFCTTSKLICKLLKVGGPL